MKKRTKKWLDIHIKRIQYYKLLKRQLDGKIRASYMALERITRGHAKEYLRNVGKENDEFQTGGFDYFFNSVIK